MVLNINCNAVPVKLAQLQVIHCMKLICLLSLFIISTEVWQQKRYRTTEVEFDCIVKVRRSLWWEIVGIIETMWAPTLGPKFSVELYCFRFVIVTMLLQSPQGGRGRMYRTRSTPTHQSPSHLQPSGNGEGLGKRFGSEPDLRFPHANHSDSPAKQRISRY